MGCSRIVKPVRRKKENSSLPASAQAHLSGSGRHFAGALSGNSFCFTTMPLPFALRREPPVWWVPAETTMRRAYGQGSIVIFVYSTRFPTSAMLRSLPGLTFLPPTWTGFCDFSLPQASAELPRTSVRSQKTTNSMSARFMVRLLYCPPEVARRRSLGIGPAQKPDNQSYRRAREGAL